MHVLDIFRFCPVCGSDRFTEHNEKSKHCDACGFTYYLNPSSATVALITNPQGELLVVRRKKNPAKDTLDLPGGFCDIGETAEEGVCREVMEETGLKVTRADYLFTVPNRYLYSGMTIPTMDQFFRCEVEDTAHVHAMDDAKDAQWLKPEDIRLEDFGLTSVRQGLARFLQEK